MHNKSLFTLHLYCPRTGIIWKASYWILPTSVLVLGTFLYDRVLICRCILNINNKKFKLQKYFWISKYLYACMFSTILHFPSGGHFKKLRSWGSIAVSSPHLLFDCCLEFQVETINQTVVILIIKCNATIIWYNAALSWICTLGGNIVFSNKT